MIEYVFGSKGSGKTKRMIDMANLELETTKGDVLFINDRDKYRAEVSTRIRFINTEEYHICGTLELYGFLCGVLASNYDIRAIYLDNFLRILDANGPESAKEFIELLSKLNFVDDVKFVLSISAEEDEAPDFMKN